MRTTKTMSAWTILAIVVTVIAQTPPVRGASRLFGVDFFSGAFVEIDKTNGSPRTIGMYGSGLNGLAWNAGSRTMYMLHEDVSVPPDSRRPTLFNVDPRTGERSSPQVLGQRLTGLTFDASQSQLYSLVYGVDSSFWSVAPNTGQTTMIGFLQIQQPLDLTTDSHGVVWGGTINGEIFTVDPTTGRATRRFAIGTGVTAVAFDENDTLYAITLVENNLIKISTNGTFVVMGGTGLFDIRGLVFASIGPPIPEPNLKIRVSEVELCWDAVSNATYRVEYRSGLTSNNWQTLLPCIAGEGGPTRIYDRIIPGEPQKYYRVVATNCVSQQ